VNIRLPSPSPPPANFDDDDDLAPMIDDEPMSTADIPMSDPAPSSPAAKVAQRKALIKKEPQSDDDDDMMEIAHSGAVKVASVNMAASRPVKKIIKQEEPQSSPIKAPDTSVDPTSWNELTEKLNVVSTPMSESKGIGKMDHKDAIEADGSLNFFWTDYTEINGSLCLFGKVLNKKTRSYVSCFVKVDNILRKLYFLPRQQRVRDGEETGDEVDMNDVYNEVDEIMTKMNVGMYKIKKCERKYAFELPNIPKEAEYMKLLYPYTSKS
jgi:DNA polymerase alpha subunit A